MPEKEQQLKLFNSIDHERTWNTTEPWQARTVDVCEEYLPKIRGASEATLQKWHDLDMSGDYTEFITYDVRVAKRIIQYTRSRTSQGYFKHKPPNVPPTTYTLDIDNPHTISREEAEHSEEMIAAAILGKTLKIVNTIAATATQKSVSTTVHNQSGESRSIDLDDDTGMHVAFGSDGVEDFTFYIAGERYGYKSFDSRTTGAARPRTPEAMLPLLKKARHLARLQKLVQ